MRTCNEERYWIKLGHNGDFNHFYEIEEVVDFLYDHVMEGPIKHCGQYTIHCANFPPINPITIYIGDEDADPIREINDSDILVLNYDLFGT